MKMVFSCFASLAALFCNLKARSPVKFTGKVLTNLEGTYHFRTTVQSEILNESSMNTNALRRNIRRYHKLLDSCRHFAFTSITVLSRQDTFMFDLT